MRRVSVSVFVCLALFVAGSSWGSPRGFIKNAKHAPSALEPFETSSHMRSYPLLSQAGDQIGLADYRVVEGTGNCCENYLAATPSGRIVDFGGTFPVYSDDYGTSWTQVRAPLYFGEGAIVGAPGGDLVGVSWDPYGGDKLYAFKYTAAQDTWEWLPMPLHTPFYDRPWISVIPGPFADIDAPYISIVRGGVPYTEPWLVSMDGLLYAETETPYLSELMNGGGNVLNPAASADADWTQPISRALISPLGAGRATYLVERGTSTASCDRMVMSSSRRWSCGPTSVPGTTVSDSQGRIHKVVMPVGDGPPSTLMYGSSNDGTVWNEIDLRLPKGGDVVQYYDHKANAELGIAVVAVHTRNPGTKQDADYLFKIDISGSQPRLISIMQIGKGDAEVYYGFDPGCELEIVGLYDCPDSRFDFTSVVILPNGKLAVGFIDSEHIRPAIAIEQ